MARASSSRSPKKLSRLWRSVIVFVLVGAAYWVQEEFFGGAMVFEQTGGAPVEGQSSEVETPNSPAKAAGPAAESKVGGYDKLDGCRVVDRRNNDGDSFWVRHGEREFELRLYYADAAEKYLSDRYENQRRRVADQARDFGGLSVDQAVELGKAAKLYTGKLLRGKSFTVYTKWERVYNGERFYSWVLLPGGDPPEYLNERLVAQGLARIHTKGVPTPDGRGFREYKAHLENLERAAKQAGKGAWGL